MNTLTWLLMALGLVSGPEAVPHRDIPYFVENPQIRRETLRRCHEDSGLASTPTCRNAEAAGTLGLGRPLSSWPKDKLERFSPSLPKMPKQPEQPGLVPPPGKGGERAA